MSHIPPHLQPLTPEAQARQNIAAMIRNVTIVLDSYEALTPDEWESIAQQLTNASNQAKPFTK